MLSVVIEMGCLLILEYDIEQIISLRSMEYYYHILALDFAQHDTILLTLFGLCHDDMELCLLCRFAYVSGKVPYVFGKY